jgi:glycosyltransferase involved in cell wall biosynthesis
MKPKVAFVVHMLTPYRLSFYKKLFSSADYEWKLFAGFKSNKVDARPQYEGNVDFPISYHKEKVSKLGIYNMIDNEGMFEAVKHYNADIVIMFAHVGTKSFRDILKWGNTNNRKVIMWTCFWEPYYIKGYKKLIRDYFIKSFYKKADYHITYSSLARERLLKIGYPDNKISIAYNGVDVDLYEAELNGQTINTLFNSQTVNFLYVGGFGKDKKVDLLINAINLYNKSQSHNINAYLIGDGPMLKECEQLVNQLNLTNSIKFLGRISEKLGNYINSADCIVLPGTGGLILNEAILFQKPFIVSNADGTENDLLINGFNGIKFLSNNALSLSNALIEVTENLSLFKENATKVKDLVTKRSNVNTMVTTFLKVLNKITNEDINNSRGPAQLHENSTNTQSY